jgi:hypothetical protein
MSQQDKRSGDATSYMTERMVLDRCLRMYRNNQWKRLYDFCMKDPRAQAWTLQRIARTHQVEVDDARVLELFSRLDASFTPRVRIETVVPGQAVSPEDVIEEVDDSIAEEVDLRSLDVPVVHKPGAPEPFIAHEPEPAGEDGPALPDAFNAARDSGAFADAARELLSYTRRLPPGVQVPLMAVEFREVASELAREGEFKLLVDLCAVLPSRITASALIDLGEKLRLGAHLNSPLLHLDQAVRGDAGKSAIKQAEAKLLAAARKVLEPT